MNDNVCGVMHKDAFTPHTQYLLASPTAVHRLASVVVAAAASAAVTSSG